MRELPWLTVKRHRPCSLWTRAHSLGKPRRIPINRRAASVAYLSTIWYALSVCVYVSVCLKCVSIALSSHSLACSFLQFVAFGGFSVPYVSYYTNLPCDDHT